MYDLFAYAQKIGGDPSNSFPSGHVAYVLLFALFYHQIRNNL
jgi:membrane-associated phospholipid phosphatase